MKTKIFLKGLLTICVFLIGSTMSARDFQITIWGYATFKGEGLSEVEVTCINSKEKSVLTDFLGFYQLTCLRDNSFVEFFHPDFGKKTLTIYAKDGLNQRHDIIYDFPTK